MIDSTALLKDLKGELRKLEADLRARSEDPTVLWSAHLQAEHTRAVEKGRTAFPYTTWREGEISQAAVAWILATVFVRFAEDNGLLAGARVDGQRVAQPWLAGPGEGVERAVENRTAFFTMNPSASGREWLEHAFAVFGALPAGRGLVDPAHSPTSPMSESYAPISGQASDALIAFWQRTDASGHLVHNFTDPEWGTRFLGDLYQDLSDYAKKTYALLQTPVFVEEFILERTLEPAIDDFGLDGLKLIDPTCGSGHFLLGAFQTLNARWAAHAPAMDARERVQKALASIHGVDLNPFAVAIARFRLTVAAMHAAGERTLVGVPEFAFQLAIGDSLLGGASSGQQLAGLEADTSFSYDNEDLQAYADILKTNQYHVVVGNPPYITVKDKALNQLYRDLYPTCAGKYALSVPFMELFFKLARDARDGQPAGYVGKITSNSFMKREFGKKVIEQFLSGVYNETGVRVDLTNVIDTSGAYIPGHGTPTVLLVGRRRMPQKETVQAVLGVRGEPGQPKEPAKGLVWTEIIGHIDDREFDGSFVSVAAVPRPTFATYPWSVSGGGASELKVRLDSTASRTLGGAADSLGITSFTLEDDAFVREHGVFQRAGATVLRPMVLGDMLRDWSMAPGPDAFFAYDSDFSSIEATLPERDLKSMWPYRTNLRNNVMFGGATKAQAGVNWTEFGRLTASKLQSPLSITFAFVATHNHFVLDRGGKVFNRSAPVIKLPAEATEDDHYELLGVLNSSTACFWLKQVSHNKGDSTDTKGARVTGDPAFDTYEFTGTKLQEFPLPSVSMSDIAQVIDDRARSRAEFRPAAVIAHADTGLNAALNAAAEADAHVLAEMVFLQEELDWRAYVAYGLADTELAPEIEDVLSISPSERPMDVALARAVAAGEDETAWFERHGRPALVDVGSEWPETYRALWRARYDATRENRALRMLEQPQFKRRWATENWESQQRTAVREALLNIVESTDLWSDVGGQPVTRTAAQLADALRKHAKFHELAELHVGTGDVDSAALIESLLDSENVPAAAAQIYKDSGLTKHAEWCKVWDLQRAEDRGERVDIPVPPKYSTPDFKKSGYWRARGKLDVPKERFISFPGVTMPNDQTPLYGWAGWTHAERGLAFVRALTDLTQAGATAEHVMPILAGLVELEPWIEQWHSEIDPAFGTSPSAAIRGALDGLLAQHEVSREDTQAWRPPAATRGRGARKKTEA